GLAYPLKRPALIGDEPERHFMQRVRQLARVCGWVDWHTLDSTGTRAGEPDLRLVRPPRVIFAELKSQHGRLRLEQSAAVALLEQCPGVETFVWRPSDWQQIVAVLR
ncbi:MAG TPA: hypothetical protein VFB50_02515, partial [Chloroflexota bacterium]|nr:hypothetical protein [Chloroflexota bacterium]